eukprot:XP_023987995.1 LOW QUALITY PROTEIN: uncharacterized protein C3orf86 homolog [Physeter catodon]
MSKSQFGQGKKPLDTFFWVNEITREITYPPLRADAPAASPAPVEKPGERPRSQRGSVQGGPPGAQGQPAHAQKAVPPPRPRASLEEIGSRNSVPATPTHSRPKPEPGAPRCSQQFLSPSHRQEALRRHSAPLG